MQKPLEIERKFLIRRPDEGTLLARGAVASEITQTYLRSDGGTAERVRMRVTDGVTVYTHTVKTRLSAMTAVEEERVITREEYDFLLLRADGERAPICKTRYCLPICGGHVPEIDVYPFWQRQAIMEIELSSEEEALDLPAGITVLREVTGDRRYSNRALASKIPDEE